MKKTLQLSVAIAILVFLIPGCNNKTGIVKPEKLGLSSDSLIMAVEKMQTFVDDAKLAGISTLVLKNGKIAFRSQHGFADIENQSLMSDDVIFRIYSMSKPITTAALMILYDEGKFKLDDKVSDYLPEFSGTAVFVSNFDSLVLEAQKKPMTIRNLLTHTAGFTYGWDQFSYVDSLYRAMSASIWEGASIGEMSNVLSGIPLKFQPGTRWEYSVSLDVAGYLVEVLSGMPYNEFLSSRIFKPLGMDNTGFWVPDDEQSRLATIYMMDYEHKKLKAAPWYTNEVKKPVSLYSGGGGLVSTIDDYSKFGQMLLNKGSLDGKRILEESTVEMIMSDQLPEGVTYTEDAAYGLGGSVSYATGVYHWSGMAATYFWIDPKNNMQALCFAQFVPNQKYSFAWDFWEGVQNALIK